MLWMSKSQIIILVIFRLRSIHFHKTQSDVHAMNLNPDPYANMSILVKVTWCTTASDISYLGVISLIKVMYSCNQLFGNLDMHSVIWQRCSIFIVTKTLRHGLCFTYVHHLEIQTIVCYKNPSFWAAKVFHAFLHEESWWPSKSIFPKVKVLFGKLASCGENDP